MRYSEQLGKDIDVMIDEIVQQSYEEVKVRMMEVAQICGGEIKGEDQDRRGH